MLYKMETSGESQNVYSDMCNETNNTAKISNLELDILL